MTWWNPLSWNQKENPAQERISQEAGSQVSTDQSTNYLNAFQRLESVNRGTSLIVNGCSSLDFDVKDKVAEGSVAGMRVKTLLTLLNYKPNPYQSIQEFRQAIFTDYVLEGNIFIYFDGAGLYHLPASRTQVIPDPKTFVAGYKYNNEIDFTPKEIIHIKDLSSISIYRGSSRLQSADRNIRILYEMEKFQENFFKNGTIHGLVIETENTLSQIAKEKTIANWVQKYNISQGTKKPIILDSGQKVRPVAEINFKDLDFDVSIKTHNERVLSALGVPPLLLNGGNNANISPNLRLFYLETVVPIVRKLVSAFEYYYGYDIEIITSTVSALQPDIKEIATYHTTLVNGGILTPNEAREELRYGKLPDLNEIRVPANIAGSAVDPSKGGAPSKANNNAP